MPLLSRHPRLVAWLGLTTVLGIMIVAVTLGRPLNAVQYLGLLGVAALTGAIAVALIFGDDPKAPDESKRA